MNGIPLTGYPLRSELSTKRPAQCAGPMWVGVERRTLLQILHRNVRGYDAQKYHVLRCFIHHFRGNKPNLYSIIYSVRKSILEFIIESYFVRLWQRYKWSGAITPFHALKSIIAAIFSLFFSPFYIVLATFF